MPTEHGIESYAAGGRRLVKARFPDFERLSAAAPTWGFDCHQLDPAEAASSLLQFSEPGLTIQRFELGFGLDQAGSTPPGVHTLGFLHPVTEVRLHRREFGGSQIGVFRPGGQFEGSSRAGFVAWTVSVEEARLEEAREVGGLLGTKSLDLCNAKLYEVDRAILGRLRKLATLGFSALSAAPSRLQDDVVGEVLGFRFLQTLAEALATGDAREPPARPRQRRLAVRRAVEFINDNCEDAIQIGDLCKLTNVGWATLVRGFREEYGVTPRAYLRAVRLNRIHQALGRGDARTVVADVANQWGLWHMGQFARDYRRLFGELPSETLGR